MPATISGWSSQLGSAEPPSTTTSPTHTYTLAPELLGSILQEKGGEEKLKGLVVGLKGGDFLAADPELDPPDLVSVEDFLKEEGLTALAA